MEKITVLIPTYNREKYIRECISSVLKQSHYNFDILIYDDGSTDRTCDIISIFISQFHNITLIKGIENKGVGYSRNKLLSNVKTKYACWLDSDDIMHPYRLEKQLECIQKTEADIVFCSMNIFNNHKSTIGRVTADISKYKKESIDSIRNNTTNPTAFFKDTLFNTKYEEVRVAEDTEWLYSHVCSGKKIEYLPFVLYNYRKHPECLCESKEHKEFVKTGKRK